MFFRWKKYVNDKERGKSMKVWWESQRLVFLECRMLIENSRKCGWREKLS